MARLRLCPVVANEQVAAEADQFPAHEGLEEVGCQNQATHREDEEGVPGEVATEVWLWLIREVAQRVDLDARGDQCDHHQHCGADTVNVDTHLCDGFTVRDQPRDRVAEALGPVDGTGQNLIEQTEGPQAADDGHGA